MFRVERWNMSGTELEEFLQNMDSQGYDLLTLQTTSPPSASFSLAWPNSYLMVFKRRPTRPEAKPEAMPLLAAS